MNRHLTDGELRASLDFELAQEQTHHLEECPTCQMQQGLIQAEQSHIAGRLAFLASEDAPAPSARAAWNRFPYRITKKKEISMFKKLFAFPVARAAAALVVVLALVLAFPQTRAFASELLKLFRVQQVTVLPIDTAGMEKLTGNEAIGERLGSLVADSTEVTREAGEPVFVADAAAASQAAGFAARLPDGMQPSSLVVSGASAFTLTLDRAKAQAFLNEAGRSDLTLPESADGARISISIPAAVSAAFGTCPDARAKTEDPDDDYADCLMFSQVPSPTVNAPASLDVAALAQVALELTGMSREEAAGLAESVDWTSTLVLPLPHGAAIHTEVSVDGVTGTLIQSESEYASQFALVWVKDGVLYFINGSGEDASPAFDLAEALP